MTVKISSLSLRYIKVNEKDKQEISMIKIIMIKEITRNRYRSNSEGEHHIEVEVSMDKDIEEDCIALIIREMTLDDNILEKHEITENKIIEVDKEGIIEMIIFKDVGLGLGIDNTEIISERNDKSSSRFRSGSRASSNRDRNMINLLRTVQLHK